MIPRREPLYGRLNLLWLLFCTATLLFGLRLFQIQLIHNVQYARAAEKNRTQAIRQTAPRGRILDRDGLVLAANQSVFSLIYLPGKNKGASDLEGLARDLAPHLRADSQDLLKTLYKAIREESAIRLAEKLPARVMFKLSELRTVYHGVNLIVEARRHYPQGAFATHLLGHMGKMDESNWRALKGQGYRVDSWIGKAGIEKVFERDLRGRDGEIRMEVDARGRLRRILESVPWKPGSNITLTIDAGIQKVAEEALRKSASGSGAAVALDPRTGEVLALASLPDYDPNWFLLPEKERDAVLKGIPEFDLAIQGSYPPGSTFKIITGAAMLNDGVVDPKDRVWCPGYFELGNHVFLCWEPKGHRYQEWLGGLAHSCDVYFYRMGLRAGGDAIERYARMFRLGEKTSLGLPGESAGRVFGPRARRARGLSWYDGDTVNLSIGQGELLVTPLQMALVIGAVANRGVFWRPSFVARIDYADENRLAYKHKPEELGRVKLKDSTWDLLRAALENAVREGTGRAVEVPGLVVGGKTGTAQNPGGRDHAWFVAYAGRPGEEPSLALAVLVQHGGHGAEAAAPVAKKMIQEAFGPGPSGAPALHISSRTAIPGPTARPAGLPVPAR